MRATINGTTLRIDLIHSPEAVAKIVRLALAGGLLSIEIHPGADDGLAIDVGPAGEVFATQALASMLALAAEVGRNSPEGVLNVWRQNMTDFDRVAKELEPATGPIERELPTQHATAMS